MECLISMGYCNRVDDKTYQDKVRQRLLRPKLHLSPYPIELVLQHPYLRQQSLKISEIWGMRQQRMAQSEETRFEWKKVWVIFHWKFKCFNTNKKLNLLRYLPQLSWYESHSALFAVVMKSAGIRSLLEQLAPIFKEMQSSSEQWDESSPKQPDVRNSEHSERVGTYLPVLCVIKI